LGVVTGSFFVIVHTVMLSERYSGVIDENELLIKLYKTKSNFLHDLNHEFRTPLQTIATSITYGISQIDRSGDLKKAGEILEVAHDETIRIGRILDGMATISALSETAENRERVDFAGLLRQRAEASRSAATRRRNELHVNIASGLPDVFIEADKYEQVVSILLINAIRRTKDGEISLTADLYDSCISVSVTNNGDGIQPEVFSCVFEQDLTCRSGMNYKL
jgi:signal transduction histidine kinase